MKKQWDKKARQVKAPRDGESDVPEAPPVAEKRVSSAGLHTNEYDRSNYKPNQGLRRSTKID